MQENLMFNFSYVPCYHILKLFTFSGGFDLLSAPELLLCPASVKNQITMFVLWHRYAHQFDLVKF
jgi:hypothetical protein